MNDLGEKLAEILNDPESMHRVRKMAENILGENEPSQTQNDIASSLPDLSSLGDMSAIFSIINQLNNSSNDARTQLLIALKPHLSEPRRDKVDTAVKILKLLELWPLIKESGIINF